MYATQFTKSNHRRSPTKTNGERSLVARGVENDVIAESEDGEIVSMVGNMGRQAYPDARMAASEMIRDELCGKQSAFALTDVNCVAYISRASPAICAPIVT